MGRLDQSVSSGGRLTKSTAPVTVPAPATAPTPTGSPYFYGKTDQGGAIGYSQNEYDSSGRPFFAYRNPNDESTTTDKRRVATTFDPRKPVVTPTSTFYNPRTPGLRESVGGRLGITKNEQLDHSMALALSGSNDPSNLRAIPSAQNEAAGHGEEALAKDVSRGRLPLLKAQVNEAKNKGIDVPWTPESYRPLADKHFSVEDRAGMFLGGLFNGGKIPSADTTAGIVGNTIAGLPRAAASTAQDFGQGILRTFAGTGRDIVNTVLPNDKKQFEIPVPHEVSAVFGNEPIKTISARTAENELALKDKGFKKSALPLAFAGTVIGSALDLTPFGGEEGAIKALAKSTDKGVVSSILRRIGLAEDLIPSYAEKIAKTSDESVISSALKKASELQKATKPIKAGVVAGNPQETLKNIESRMGVKPVGRLKVDRAEYDAGHFARKPIELSPELEQRKTALEIEREQTNNNPLNNLTKYVSKSGEFKGRLGEVTGTGKGKFSRRGDDLLTEHLGNIGSEEARSKYEKFAADKQNLTEKESQLKQDINAYKKTSKEQSRIVSEENRNHNQAVDENGSRLHQTQPSKGTTQSIDRAKNASLPKYTQIPTKNKVELNINGNTVKQRVESAITNSERVKNELTIKGKDTYALGRQFSNPELKSFRDKYQAGVPIEEIATKSSKPSQAQKYLNQVKDYYDLQLAHDRAIGGLTANEPNHLVQNWNLDNPKDLTRFNDMAKQRGLQPYDGFHAQPKVFKTYAEGEAAGFKPKNTNMNEDLLQHSQQASHVISRQVLKKGLTKASPRDVSMSGLGKTAEGKPFVNSNIKGLEGISYHPNIHNQLKGFEPSRNIDVLSLIKDKGFEPSKPSTYSRAWDGLKESGVLNTVGTLYDRSTTAMKHFLLNFSGFHSLNVSSNFAGASIFNPIAGTKGLAMSIPSFFSEKVTQKVIDGFKSKLVKGQDFSVFDSGIRSGVNMERGLPAQGFARLNPMSALSRAMFDRELYTLKLHLVDQVFGQGKVLPESAKGRALGKEINMIMGEMNTRTMNINPNVQKWISRVLLAPQFTESKYKLIGDALTKSSENGGGLARTAIIGKSLIMGTLATLGTVLMTGKFPNLQQVLLNYTLKPSSQTNLTNSEGQKQDIGYPQTFVTEPASLIADPVHYAQARLAPVASDALSIWTNKDYYGNPIYDKNKPESALSQYGKNVGLGDLPIGIQSIIKQAQGKQSGEQTALQIAGLKTRVSSVPVPDKQNALDAYTKVQNLIKSGDKTGAQKAIDSLTDAEYKEYKKIKTAEKSKGTDQLKVKVRPIFNQIQSFIKQGQTGQAQKLLDSLTDEEYHAYKLLRK